MNALSELAEAEARRNWKPRSAIGRALKEHEDILAMLVRKGHGDKAIFERTGLDPAEFNRFRAAMRGLREHLREDRK